MNHVVRFLALLPFLPLAACGASRPALQSPTEAPAGATAAESPDTQQARAATEAYEAGFRPFTHSLDTTCVPDDPQRVITPQDQNALLPLLEPEFTAVVGSVGSIHEDGSTCFRHVDAYDR